MKRQACQIVILVWALLFVACQTVAPRTPDEPWRNEIPPAKPTTAPTLPQIQKTVLPNGLTVMLVEDHHLPIFAARLVVSAGSAQDGTKHGLAEMTFDLLDESVGKLDTVALSRAFSDLGTQAITAAGPDAGLIAVPAMTKYLDRSLELISLMATQPRFLATDFERVKTQRLATLKNRAASPDAVASDRFLSAAYGAEHPYGHPPSGSVETVSKLTLADAKKYWQSYFGPKNAALVFAGDLTMAKAKSLAEKYFGDWKAATQKPAVIPTPKQDGLSTVDLISRPDSPQTVLYLGRPLIRANSPDQYALLVFNEILGGMFTSRLNLNLRQEKAWTYGVQSSIEGMRGLGPFIVETSIQVPYAGPALAEIMDEFRLLTKEEVSEDELSQAKKGILLSMPAHFETVGALATQATQIYVYDLPLNYYERTLQEVEKVTAHDVKKAAQLVLDPKKRLAIVAVGELDAMKKPIEELKLGKVKVTQD